MITKIITVIMENMETDEEKYQFPTININTQGGSY